MNVTINGELHQLRAATTIADLISAEATGIAVALNGIVVRGADHARTILTEGDVIEIVTAVQGG